MTSTPGVGSNFWVELPLAPDPVGVAQAARSGSDGWNTETTAPSSATILYVEDNLSNLRLVQMLLDSCPGVQLLSAGQGSRGLSLARSNPPDLLLLDLHLPDLPGWEVLRQLQADPLTRDIPVVIISADATPGQITRLLAAGAKDYLAKPIDVPQLLRVIREHTAPASATACA